MTPKDLLQRPLTANLATVKTDGAQRIAPLLHQWQDGAQWRRGSVSLLALDALFWRRGLTPPWWCA